MEPRSRSARGSKSTSDCYSNKIVIVRRILLYLSLSLVSFGQNPQPGIFANWFPIHPGDKWIYDHDDRNENGNGRAHPVIERWRTEQTITGSWTIPEGTLIETRVEPLGTVPSTIHVQPNPAYLIRGNCLYESEVDWTPATHQLTDSFRQGLLAGEYSPDFCFPLMTGKTWGHEGTRDWKATEIRAGVFRIRSISYYPGSGQTEDIVFEKGVGILSQHGLHHGTYGEQRVQLVKFEPAR